MLEFMLEKLLLPPRRFNRFWFSFVLGVFYSLFGLALAVSTGVGILAIFVVAIAIQPFLSRFFSVIHLEQVRRAEREKSMESLFEGGLAPAPKVEPALLADFAPLFSQYTAFFLGIFATCVLFALAGDSARVLGLFGLQASMATGSSAAPLESLVVSLLMNNAGVLCASFFLALLLEFGASLVTVWNAVFWGILVTVRMRQAVAASMDPLSGYFLLVVIMPHLILEALAYISAMFSGGILGAILVNTNPAEGLTMARLRQPLELLGLAIGFLVLGALLEAMVFHFVLKL
jgi:hypothetical protein